MEAKIKSIKVSIEYDDGKVREEKFRYLVAAGVSDEEETEKGIKTPVLQVGSSKTWERLAVEKLLLARIDLKELALMTLIDDGIVQSEEIEDEEE